MEAIYPLKLRLRPLALMDFDQSLRTGSMNVVFLEQKKQHQKKIQNLIEMKGISYISTPRPNKRGGGSAITCNAREFALKQIHIPNPDKLEITFGIVRSKHEEAKDLTIIVMAVYCPPKSKKHEK